MAETFIGEIRMFGGNFAPKRWAMCEGQLLSISQYDALYDLLGTTYGGDGRTTFALPDLRGRVPVGEGSGPGLTPRYQGEAFGYHSATLTSQNLPNHNHRLQATTDPAEVAVPQGKVLAAMREDTTTFYEDIDNIPEDEIKPFSPQCVGHTGGGQAHENRMPFLCVNFIISLAGVYPSRH